jgi:hypothetical protein
VCARGEPSSALIQQAACRELQDVDQHIGPSRNGPNLGCSGGNDASTCFASARTPRTLNPWRARGARDRAADPKAEHADRVSGSFAQLPVSRAFGLSAA